MNEPKISDIWPEWELVGFLRDSSYGKVYRIRRKAAETEEYSAVEVISVPTDRSSVASALKRGVSDDALRAYFDRFKDDFMWEMTMVRKISSPHLVPMKDMMVLDNEQSAGWTGYIRTDIYTPLPEYFSKNRLCQDEVVRLARELYEALTAAGGYGMVHGEINPENIFVTDDCRFLLGGFGVRRCIQKAQGRPSGDFDAPEVFEEGKYSPQSDIYSLGMVMAYVLNGGSLPTGKNISLLTDADPHLIELIKKATSYEPEDRFASAAEMRAALDKAALYGKGLPIKPWAVKTAAQPQEMPETEAGKPETDACETAPSEPEAKQKKQIFTKRNIMIGAAVLIILLAAAVLLILQPWDQSAPADSGTATQIFTEVLSAELLHGVPYPV